MLTLPLANGQVVGRITQHAPAACRIRIEVEGLEGDPLLAHRLEEHFTRFPWVREARADTRTGRILLTYDPAEGFSPALVDSPPPVPSAETRAPNGHLRKDRADEHAWSVRRSGNGRTPGNGHDGNASQNRWAAPTRAPGTPLSADAGVVPPWHARTVDETLASLRSRLAGLTRAEAQAQLKKFGPNIVDAERVRGRLEILFGQVANVPTALLLGGAVVSAALGDFFDAGAIVVVVGLNTAIGYRIERKNEALLASWRRLEAGDAQVLRDGQVRPTPAGDLVPGDVVLLRVGDVVPADARVIDAHRLTCDEAPLTGESEPQLKHTEPVDEQRPLAERRSMLYAGTVIVGGRGRAVVVATGAVTELARVRRLVEQTDETETPLERRLAQLGRRATAIGVGAAVVMAAGGILRGQPAPTVVRQAVALGVAAIPEGLPVVSTAALVQAMSRMRRQGMVVRRIAAAETLGGVTVVCVDKTGTLTMNELSLEVLEVDGKRVPLRTLKARLVEIERHRPTLALAAGLLNSEIDFHRGDNGVEASGTSTELALVRAAQKAGLEPLKLRKRYPRRILEGRHDSVHYVLSVHDGPNGAIEFVKGAPEQVLELCTHDARGPLDEKRRRTLLERNQALADQGHRVLALAWRRHEAKATKPGPGFDFIGLAGLRDPLRPGAAEAVHAAGRAGIRTLILTGDQRATAAAIAREVGIAGDAVDGAELVSRLEAGEPGALSRLGGVAVLSRVSPADKLAIVSALRRSGEIVAMAGDGINDAPALKAADVGIAVGAGASDIARRTADVVLEHGDLRSILGAVAEGRVVQDNLRRSVRFLLASNLSEVLITLGGLALPFEPLSSLQLLWVNLLTDTLPALALALEPGDRGILARKPVAPGAPILSRAEWGHVGRDGALLALLGGAGYFLGGPAGVFGTLVAGQLGYTFACRAGDVPPGRRFFGLVGSAIGLQVAGMLLPGLRSVLRLPALSLMPVVGFSVGLLAPLVARALSGSSGTLAERTSGLIYWEGRPS